MKDICFLSGLIVGAGIGMIVAAKNKQIKKIIDCGEHELAEAAREVKQTALEPICECVNNTQESNTKMSKKNGKKQNPQNKEK